MAMHGWFMLILALLAAENAALGALFLRSTRKNAAFLRHIAEKFGDMPAEAPGMVERLLLSQQKRRKNSPRKRAQVWLDGVKGSDAR